MKLSHLFIVTSPKVTWIWKSTPRAAWNFVALHYLKDPYSKHSTNQVHHKSRFGSIFNTRLCQLQVTHRGLFFWLSSGTPQASQTSKYQARDTSSTVLKVKSITFYKPKSLNASNDSSQRHSSKNASKVFLLDLKTWNPDQNCLHLSALVNCVMSALMINIASRSQ